MSIGNAGGFLQSAGHGAIVFVPAGALKNPNLVTVAAQDAATFPTPALLASHVYYIGPSGFVSGSGVNITLSVLGTLPTGVRPTLAYLNDQNAWQVVPNSTFNAKANTVHGVVTHFTNFAILLIPADGSGCAQSPDPNAYCSPSTCSLNQNVCASSTGLKYYGISGVVQGLTGSPITIVLNGRHTVTVPTDGNFYMGSFVPSGGAYALSVPSQPNNTICTITNGTGTMANANVTNVAIACQPTQALVGTVTGLDLGAQVTLQNGNTRIVVRGIAAPFSFPRMLPGTNYNVTIAAQPSNQVCTVPSGVGVTAQADIFVAVTCRDLSFHLGGTVAGLLAHTYVTLANGNDVVRSTNGNYVFPTVVHNGNNYNASLISPVGQNCTFTGSVPSSGVMPDDPVSTLNVSCLPLTYSFGGAVSGLTGNTNLTVSNANVTTSAGNGTYVISQVAYASHANVTIAPPTGQTCRFSNGSSAYAFVMGAGAMTNMNITCTMNAYTIGGTVTGLVAQASVLLTNANSVSKASNGKYILAGTFTYGTDYNISIASPAGQSCAFVGGSNGIGTMGAANVTNLNVTCSPLTFALGGTISGVVANANVVLSFGGQSVSATNGTYTFATPIAYNTRYLVVFAAPANQQCQFSPPSNNVGTIGLGNVNNVNVTCTPKPFTLGGNISGLVGTNTVLMTSGVDRAAFRNGNYHFPTAINYDSNYTAALISPPNHTCHFSPANGNVGIMGGANISDLNVVCTPASFPLGGQIIGLLANTNVTITQGNASITAGNGNYAFPMLAYGTPYTLALTQPTGQACVLFPTSAASGSMPAAPVNANVLCSIRSYSIGGSVSGLTGTLRLTNGNDVRPIYTNGSFNMPTSIPYQTHYNVSISAQPNHQLCIVTQGNGIVGAANVTTVLVNCGPAYRLSGSVSNLVSGGNVVVANGQDAVTVVADDPNWTLPTRLAPGADYNIVVMRQPTGETCKVALGSGVMPTQSIENIAVQCNMTLRFTTHQSAARVIGQKDFVSTARTVDHTHFSLFDANRTTKHRVVGNQNFLAQIDEYEHRVFFGPHAGNTFDASVVVGQTTFSDNTPGCTQAGLHTPRGASVTPKDALLVADTINNRVMIWITPPTTNAAAADIVLGQPDFTTCTRPDNDASSASTLSEPFDVWSDGTHVLVADTLAARVLIWNTFPVVHGQGADAVLGQPNFTSNNAGFGLVSVGGPTGVTSDGNSIFVAEYSYSRVTQWSGLPWSGQVPTLTAVLGEPDALTASCNLNGQLPSANTLCQASGLAIVGTQLIVSDFNNNRLLVYESK